MAFEEKLFEIAKLDLVRLGKRYNLETTPKSSDYLVVWRSTNIPFHDYTIFKNAYICAEDGLRRWVDSQRWLHKVDFSDCWLAVGPSLDDADLLQFFVHKKYEHPRA